MINKSTICYSSSSYPPYIIAIDPGHGGIDTGAEAIVIEVDVCDMTAKYLFDLLQNDPNFIPIYTRTKDSSPKVKLRAETANQAGASLLISIHANSDSSKSSKGFECFPIPPGRTFHEESLNFAKILTKNMKNAGHNLRGGEEKSGIKYAYYNGSNKKIVDSSDSKIRNWKTFGILENANCPAILSEQCFVTNYNDVENWTGEEGCKKAAQIYYESINEFFKINYTY